MVLRRFMFPKGRLPLAEIAARARELDARLVEAATQRGVRLIEFRPDWYGFDPIHLKLSRWHGAWHEILAGFADAAPPPTDRGHDVARWLYLWSRGPSSAGCWVTSMPLAALRTAGRRNDDLDLLRIAGEFTLDCQGLIPGNCRPDPPLGEYGLHSMEPDLEFCYRDKAAYDECTVGRVRRNSRPVHGHRVSPVREGSSDEDLRHSRLGFR